ANGGCARSIAEHFGLSRAFVANILKELCQKGFVVSHRGVKGGYALLRPASDISLAELLESMEDGFQLASCNNPDHSQGGDHECSVLHVCPIRGPIGELHQRIIESLRGISIGDLFRPGSPATIFQPLLETIGIREPGFAAVATET